MVKVKIIKVKGLKANLHKPTKMHGHPVDLILQPMWSKKLSKRATAPDRTAPAAIEPAHYEVEQLPLKLDGRTTLGRLAVLHLQNASMPNTNRAPGRIVNGMSSNMIHVLNRAERSRINHPGRHLTTIRCQKCRGNDDLLGVKSMLNNVTPVTRLGKRQLHPPPWLADGGHAVPRAHVNRAGKHPCGIRRTFWRMRRRGRMIDRIACSTLRHSKTR